MKKTDKLPLATSGWVYLVSAVFLAGVATALDVWVMAAPLWLVAAFVLYFFRDPPRATKAPPAAVVSPADGKVVAVEEVETDKMPGGRGKLVSIFMNLFDVHVNRAPISGRVESVAHYPGGFKSADLPQARMENERQEVLLTSDLGRPLLVNQVAGLVARRIECRLIPGDLVQRGERYGMIRFGSRLDVYLPMDASIVVSPGQRVKAGVSIIGEM